MKTLLIVTLIISSTFAFSETRESFNNGKQNELARIKGNQFASAIATVVTAGLANKALIIDSSIIKMAEKNPKMIAKKADRNMFRATKYVLRSTALVLASASIMAAKNFYDNEKGKSIENNERNTREKVAKTSKKITTREISAIDMN